MVQFNEFLLSNYNNCSVQSHSNGISENFKKKFADKMLYISYINLALSTVPLLLFELFHVPQSIIQIMNIVYSYSLVYLQSTNQEISVSDGKYS